ncbi:MAG: RluA family pseudouridine synthase [Bdellovibrionales bacterium]|nr:RluA family pseudouridine synthase [Bdellovibrionales bacterium]
MALPDPRFTFTPAQTPRVIFEDTHLAVFDKPFGLLSQGDISGEASLVDYCRQHFGRNYVGLVHRLDRNTSGLIVVAKRSKAANRLTESLKEGTLVRTYLAWLVGRVPAPATWENLLLKDEKTNTVRVVQSIGPSKAKMAKLSVKPVSYLKPDSIATPCLTLCEFVLDTGRSHQIRVQSHAAGFPLLGDTKYAAKNGPTFSRTALHSHRIRFPHPMSDENLEFLSPLPADLQIQGTVDSA